jgi:geranylgeranyl pyrophosphate synthase
MAQAAFNPAMVPDAAPPAPDAAAADMIALLEETFSRDHLTELLGQEAGSLPREIWEEALLGPLRRFLSRPGKAIRAQLLEDCWEAAGGRGTFPELLPLLVEMIHAGSLIVDDIQDHASVRRGAPALHHLFGMPRALNAGNWLYYWPAVLLDKLPMPESRRAEALRLMNDTLYQCHFGQALDISVTIDGLDQKQVRRAVMASTQLKTGRLMAFAAALGAMSAGADDRRVQGFRAFGAELGLGLQMLDDYSAMVNDNRKEKAREDLINGSPTWAWAWAAGRVDAEGYAELRRKAGEVAARRMPFETLRLEVKALIAAHGKAAIRRQLSRAMNTALPVTTSPASADKLRREIDRLEKCYG